jgi:hypothetical protein
MIPPRSFPPGVLQLFEIIGDEKNLIQEFPTSSRNRDRINQMRNDLLMVDPTRNLVVSENNSFNPPKGKTNDVK